MAPSRTKEASPAPLADFFWIAGPESSDILATFQKEDESNNNGGHIAPVEATIEEDTAEESDGRSPSDVSMPSWEHQKRGSRSSLQRLSKLSNDARFSTISNNSDSKGTTSNRSSATIRVIPLDTPSFLNDVDFDKALRRFASERDSFLADLSLNAGAIVPERPKARQKVQPKTQKIVSEDVSGLKSGFGTVRRHMSFREMNSMKRQPSLARQGSDSCFVASTLIVLHTRDLPVNAPTASVRTSRRLSNYNSVIPVPQPLDAAPDMHPLKRKFEPVLLDRYPPKGSADEVKHRTTFPEYVPMFAFPNDINIVSSDQRPRSTWHGFAMTGGDNSKVYGICVLIWIPLNPTASQALEKRCEEWRREHMSDEERELAASLGERLGHERATLSRLLARLPTVSSGSVARESLEDEISAVEEKIGLMSDLLRPVRHGAASKIDGLTDGDTGFWIPRAYGILGRDSSMTAFWKEWLRAVVVPMTDGGVLRVSPSSPKVGLWQPLEKYVINLCTESLSPTTSKTQVEIAIRELRLYARREAMNELPGSRNTDLYALFRALSVPNIVILFEYAISESRIILLSSHTSMLHLVSKALVDLLFPLVWAGVFIPVLPARLIQALEAPCPYIVGIERRYERTELPEDDFVLVDLDQNEIESTARPTPLPRQQRRKLTSLLQLAAPHHYKYGVAPGPPAYAIETFPNGAFQSENSSIFTPNPQSTSLAKFVGLNSASFGNNASNHTPRPLIFNAFLQARVDHGREERTISSSTSKDSSTSSPKSSPISGSFPNLPATPTSRNDSGFALQSSLREKRSGHFDSGSRRSSSFGLDKHAPLRRPSLPFVGHAPSVSTHTLNAEPAATSTYAPSTYAQSTLAASTIMPQVLMQPVRNTESMAWVEGHCLQWRPREERAHCSICDEKPEDGIYKCTGCGTLAHGRCASQICIVCPAAFHPEQIHAAFVRCFASLFYTYRKFLMPATGDQKKSGMLYTFNMDGFLRSLPHENADYMAVLRQTQGFNEFIHQRCTTSSTTPNPADPSVPLFDAIINSKRLRNRLAPSSLLSSTSAFLRPSTPNIPKNQINLSTFLSDTSDHLWRSVTPTPPSQLRLPSGSDYRAIITRCPAKLDPKLMSEPRAVQGVPLSRSREGGEGAGRRKPIPLSGKEGEGNLRRGTASKIAGAKQRLNGLALSPP